MDRQTDGQADGRSQVHYLPRFAVDYQFSSSNFRDLGAFIPHRLTLINKGLIKYQGLLASQNVHRHHGTRKELSGTEGGYVTS